MLVAQPPKIDRVFAELGLADAESGVPERVMPVSRKLLSCVSQFVSWNRGVVTMDEVLSTIRGELENQRPCFEMLKPPVQWLEREQDEFVPPWALMYLKLHQILSQLLADVPADQTARGQKSNAYETMGLASLVYGVDLDQPESSSVGVANRTSSDSTSTKASLTNNTGNECVPTTSVNTTAPSSPLSSPVAPPKHILASPAWEAIETMERKLWPETEVYVYIAPGLWKEGEEPSKVKISDSCILIPIDEGQLSMAVTSAGRFDAYLLASVVECVLPLIEREEPHSLLKLPTLLGEDKHMCLCRAAHARRVYNGAVNTHVITEAKYNWYVTLLTSGSLRAIQDTFVDFAQEVWHAQFTRSNPQNHERLETLMIGILGHPHDLVRSQATVCLSNLIDNHDWQQEVPFLPVVKPTNSRFVIEISIEQAEMPNVFLILSAPSSARSGYAYTYHSLEWSPESGAVGSGFHRTWRGVCDLGVFTRSGFYDWRAARCDCASGSWRPIHAAIESLRRSNTGSMSFATATEESQKVVFRCQNLYPEISRLREVVEATGQDNLFNTFPLQGRFVVQNYQLRDSCLHDITVDLWQASFSANGHIEERGTFSKVQEHLGDLRDRGVDTVCLTGCQARNNGEVSYTRSGDRRYANPEASPYAVTCRGSVCQLVEGRDRFDELVKEAHRQAMRVVVEVQSRISVANAHRKYNDRYLWRVDDEGRITKMEGGQGKCFEATEACELNYRERENWVLYINDVCEWISTHRADGVRVDLAHMLPRIYAIDEVEMNKLDVDGFCHYTPLEKLRGTVVRPSVKDSGYWTSTAANSHWPNPFFVMLCKALWHKNHQCVVIGDCGLLNQGEEKKLGTLARSGVIPFVQSLPDVLLRVFGKHLDLVDQSIRDVPVEEPTKAIGEWYERTHSSLPDGALMIQSSSTLTSPLPTMLYNRGAWPAADMLFLNNDIPCTVMGEDEGKALRRGLANVNTDEGSPTAGSPGMRSDNSAVFSRAKSLAKFESPEAVAQLEKDFIKSFPSESGQDINQIAAHYKHRRELRRRYPIISERPIMPVSSVYGQDGKRLERVFASCRIDDAINVALVLTNFDELPVDVVEVHLGFLSKLVGSRHPVSSTVVECWGLFTCSNGTYNPNESAYKSALRSQEGPGAIPNDATLMTLAEFLAHYHQLRLEGYQSAGLGFKMLTHDVADKELMQGLYLGSLERLRQLAGKCAHTRAVDGTLDHQLTMAVISNYVVQSLMTATKAEGMADFATCWMQLTRALEREEKLTRVPGSGGKPAAALKDIPGLLLDVGLMEVMQNKGDMASRFFAKLRKMQAGLKSHKLAPPLTSTSSGEGRVGVSAADEASALAHLGALTSSLCELEQVGPIVFVTTELGKWSTVGGLGVMVDELTSTMSTELGYESICISPYYHVNRKGQTDYLQADGVEWRFNIDVSLGPHPHTFGVHTGRVNNVEVVFIHNERIFHHPYPDNPPEEAVRFLVAIGKASLEALCQLKIQPQVLITNDWATGLVAAYAKRGFFGQWFQNTTFFHIIHNFDPAYEGRIYTSGNQDYCWLHNLPRNDLIDPLWSTQIINPSRCVLLNADQWGTVSCSYRDDLMGRTGDQPSPLACLLNRFPRPYAIANGVRVTDRLARIAALPFQTHSEAKAELQKKYFGFESPDLAIPLFAFIGRVTTQKGVHLILEAAENIIHRYNNRVQIIVGGPVTWKDPYSARCGHQMLHLKTKYPWSFFANPNEFFVDGTLVNVGADFGLMPSLFEPGGIVQQEFFIGSTPVIAFRTGGLKDTVHEFDLETMQGNGFTFNAYNLGDFVYAWERAMRVYSEPKIYTTLRANAKDSVFTTEQCASGWLGEICKLRNKVLINPKNVQQIYDTLPATFDPADCLQKSNFCLPPASPPVVRRPLKAVNGATTINSIFKPCQFRFLTKTQTRSVAVSGSFDNWALRRPLTWDNSLGCWRLDTALKPGQHKFKFIVDGQWRCSDYHDKNLDKDNNENNTISI